MKKKSPKGKTNNAPKKSKKPKQETVANICLEGINCPDCWNKTHDWDPKY
jgi:hypothetical protein